MNPPISQNLLPLIAPPPDGSDSCFDGASPLHASAAIGRSARARCGELPEPGCARLRCGSEPSAGLRTPRVRAACRRPSIPIGRSPSTTGRWWMPCSVIRIAAASSVVVGETVMGSAVIHWRTRASLGVHAGGERAQQVARGEDPDQPPVVGDERPSRRRARASSRRPRRACPRARRRAGRPTSRRRPCASVRRRVVDAASRRRSRAARVARRRARPRPAMPPGGRGSAAPRCRRARRGTARGSGRRSSPGGHQSGSGLASDVSPAPPASSARR